MRIIDRLLRIPTSYPHTALYAVIDVDRNEVLETLTAGSADEAIATSIMLGDSEDSLLFALVGGQGVIVIPDPAPKPAPGPAPKPDPDTLG